MSNATRVIRTERAKRFWPIACFVLALCGCPASDPPQDDGSGSPPKGVKLQLLVVDDPGLATAVERLRGEWESQSGSDFEVRRISQSDLTVSEPLQADIVICAAGLLGELALKRGIQTVPEGFLDDHKWTEVFSLLRGHEVVWQDDVVAVPLGSAVLTCYYRADLFDALELEPPDTWKEYGDLALQVSDRENLGNPAVPADVQWHGAIEPLGYGWAGLVLLSRAASYATHRENYSTLFNIDSMEPLIDGPPFVRALEELVSVAKLGPPAQLDYDPDAARDAFWRGECAMTLSWPTPTATATADAAQGIMPGFAELPGSTEAYDVSDLSWETRREDEDPHVTLLGVAGRVGVVLGESKWPKAAFRLLYWLSYEQSSQASAKSPATTLFRQSHLQSAGTWVEPPVPAAAAAQYAAITQQTLSRPQCLFALRIPGRADYLAALDEAVHKAVKGEATPRESLQQAADRWREVTQQLGVETQREAYWSSLGLE